MTQPSPFVLPTPIPHATIAAWISQAANVQVAWIHAPQHMLGAQGKPGVLAWVYLNISRYKQYGLDDYREASSAGTTLSGTVNLVNGSATVNFAAPQTLAAGQVLVFSSQPGQPYSVDAATVASTVGVLTTPYAGPTTATATMLDTLAANLTGQRRVTVSCRAESFQPDQAHPIELLERIRWYGRTFTTDILENANISYAETGDILSLPPQKEGTRLKLVAQMDLHFNFAVNNYPVGVQAPGDTGTVIETVNEGTQEPDTDSTILGTVSQG
jgi:hypothetical protein